MQPFNSYFPLFIIVHHTLTTHVYVCVKRVFKHVIQKYVFLYKYFRHTNKTITKLKMQFTILEKYLINSKNEVLQLHLIFSINRNKSISIRLKYAQI